MRILYWPQRIAGLLFDVDETVYPKNPAYQKHQREVERLALAAALNTTSKEAGLVYDRQAIQLKKALNRVPSAGEVIRGLGFSQQWLMDVRSIGWQPDGYISKNTHLAELINQLSTLYKVGFVSTSPYLVVKKILCAIGLPEDFEEKILIIGGGQILPKPDPQAYLFAASKLGVERFECLSIGDRLDFDCVPAQQVGMGAAWVESIDDTVQIAEKLLTDQHSQSKESQC